MSSQRLPCLRRAWPRIHSTVCCAGRPVLHHGLDVPPPPEGQRTQRAARAYLKAFLAQHGVSLRAGRPGTVGADAQLPGVRVAATTLRGIEEAAAASERTVSDEVRAALEERYGR